MRLDRRAVKAAAASTVLALAGTSCVADFLGGPGANTPAGPPGPGAETLVIVAESADTLVALGQTRTFVAELRDGNGLLIRNHPTTWSIDQSGVASVDVRGVATAIGNGTATIRVHADGLTATATVTVWQAVASIVIDPDTFKLGMFDSQELAANALDPLGNPVTRPIVFSWKSSNSVRVDVESDDETGTTATATRTSRGTTLLVASTEGKSGSATAR